MVEISEVELAELRADSERLDAKRRLWWASGFASGFANAEKGVQWSNQLVHDCYDTMFPASLEGRTPDAARGVHPEGTPQPSEDGVLSDIKMAVEPNGAFSDAEVEARWQAVENALASVAGTSPATPDARYSAQEVHDDFVRYDALEILCRVFFDGADVAHQEWLDYYKPSEWMDPSRALGAFIFDRIERLRGANATRQELPPPVHTPAPTEKRLVEIEKALNEACGIIEVGDQRLLAGDGPVGSLPPDISLAEWRRLYLVLDRARAKMLLVRHGDGSPTPAQRVPGLEEK